MRCTSSYPNIGTSQLETIEIDVGYDYEGGTVVVDRAGNIVGVFPSDEEAPE